jgi:hypothetical protein
MFSEKTTPLHLAAQLHGKKAVFKKANLIEWTKWLLAHGASPENLDDAGKRPEDYTKENGKLYQLLRDARVQRETHKLMGKSLSQVLECIDKGVPVTSAEQDQVDRLFRDLPGFLEALDREIEKFKGEDGCNTAWVQVYGGMVYTGEKELRELAHLLYTTI